MVKVTPEKLAAWEAVAPHLGERQAALKLGGSQSGFRAARARRDGPVRKDRRGNSKKYSPAVQKRILKFRDKIKKDGGAPYAPYVKRKLKLAGSVRTVQRTLTSDGNKYRNRPAGTYLTPLECECREKHCTKRLVEKYDFTDIACYMDTHSCRMPLEKAPHRSNSTYYSDAERDAPYIARKKKHKYVIAPCANLFGGCFPPTGGQFVTSFTGTFTAETLCEKFRRVVIPALRRNCGPPPWKCIMDGDGAFNSTAFKQLCEEEGIIREPHPANSPDMNPQENGWSKGDAYLEVAVWETKKWSDGIPGTGKQIPEEEKEAWAKFCVQQQRKVTKTFFKNCTSQDSMESRCCAVIAANGRRITGY